MADVENSLSGGCACGAVRYAIHGAPIFVNHCHCTLCQKQTGSVGVVNAFIEWDMITQTSGQTSQHIVKSGSGGDHVIIRCTDCGTALWSFYPRFGELGAGVRVGTMDNPAALTPDAMIFTANRMPWVSLPQDIPQFEASFDPAQLLPPERFARLAVLIEKRASQKAMTHE